MSVLLVSAVEFVFKGLFPFNRIYRQEFWSVFVWQEMVHQFSSTSCSLPACSPLHRPLLIPQKNFRNKRQLEVVAVGNCWGGSEPRTRWIAARTSARSACRIAGLVLLFHCSSLDGVGATLQPPDNLVALNVPTHSSYVPHSNGRVFLLHFLPCRPIVSPPFWKLMFYSKEEQ